MILFIDKIVDQWPEKCKEFVARSSFVRFLMSLSQDFVEVSDLEMMILEEIVTQGKIMVRSLDKIHARTGINYATISRVADKLQGSKQL